ncbi:DUF1566 domain-containing protein [Leptospira noguchii]|uniref:PF07603 family protein n=1 Tax=Leptospira noguchii serovar Panama str. CZ214 TaxID=1001595 RepID=T0GUW7_9LEPT|nr:DUF1566 domain-containing protein [Leptospira noguchii]EQA72692.1 PF07603 family protein [Leptospira noguchii serovar Panama str. CZ214]
MNSRLGLSLMFAVTSFFVFCSQADRVSIDSSSTAGLLFQGSMEVFLMENQNQDDSPITSEEPKEITSFRFQATDHFFVTDFVGEVSENRIIILVPFGAIPRLKATFVTTGVRVEVNGVPQSSGQTINDFSSPLTYRVIASDESFRDYAVQALPIFRLTDAGQTSCYSFCFDDPGQDADYSTGTPSTFQSNVIMPGYTPQPVTFDRQTGLIWGYCPVGGSNTICSMPYNYTQLSASSYCNNLNQMNAGLGYAGIQGWRLPEIEELMTLSTYKTPTNAYINLSEFPLGDVQLWSNTTNAVNTNEAWGFSFDIGFNTSTSKSISSNMKVRCVSGSRMPDQIYSDLNNGAVRDDRTNLVWQKCSVGQTWSPNFPDCNLGSPTIHNFVSALYTCQNLNLADRTWRLPNVHELRSLLDFSSSSAGAKIDPIAFPNTPAVSQYNASNSIPHTQVFKVNFTNATINTAALSTQSYLRCVSDGP